MASVGLINKVKYSPIIYNVYFYIGSMVIKFVGLFIKKDPHLIVFSSFGGRKFDDSPKCIYEQILLDHRFDSFEIIWAFIQPEDIHIARGKKVKTDTWGYYRALLRAGCWVTNSAMERGLSFKDNRTFYYNSWHGTPMKLMGSDIDKSNKSFGSKSRTCPYDVFCAQSQFDADIFMRCFGVPEQSMKIIGLPRNDELIMDSGESRKRKIKRELGISDDKKVILYAPTFREFNKDDNMNCVMAPPMSIEKWKDTLGNDYVLLFRAHYEVVKVMNLHPDDFLKDVSSYPSLNDLMIVSDILISDYSSIFFDYSIMEKSMLCFAYDYDEYVSKRGLYFDIRKELDCMGLDTEDAIISSILQLDENYRKAITRVFRDKYVTYYGTATKKSLDIIYDAIN